MSVESRASDLNFFSGTCSVVWWDGVLYFLSVNTHRKPIRGEGLKNRLKKKGSDKYSEVRGLLSTVACEWTWWLLTGWEGLSISSDPGKEINDFKNDLSCKMKALC